VLKTHFWQNVVLEDGVDSQPFFSKFLEDPPPLSVSEGDVVWIVVVPDFVGSEAVPLPPKVNVIKLFLVVTDAAAR